MVDKIAENQHILLSSIPNLKDKEVCSNERDIQKTKLLF